MKKIVSIILSAAIAAGAFGALPTAVSAAKSPVSLKKSSATLNITEKKDKTVYGSAKIKIKKSKGVVINKLTFKSSAKRIAKVSAKGKVTAVKKGEAEISVRVSYSFKKHDKVKKLTFKVKVKDTRKKSRAVVQKPTEAPTEAFTEAPTEEPTAAPTEAPTETPTEAPTEATTEAPTETPTEVPTETPTEATTETPTEAATEIPSEAETFIEPDDSTVPETEAPTTEPTAPETTPATEEETSPESGGEADQISTDPAQTEPVTEPETEPATEPATEPVPDTFEGRLSAFSNKLYAMCAADKDGNYIMSPVSVYFALTLLHSTGDATVKQEVEELLGMTAENITKTADLFKKLSRTLERYNEETGENEKVGEVSLTNSAWFEQEKNFNKDAMEKLTNELLCQIKTAPFCNDNVKANQMIREFVKEATRGLIDKDFELSESTLIALINTIYFKDVWDLKDGDLHTQYRDFYTADGAVNTEFLHGKTIAGKIQDGGSFEYFYSEMAHGYKIKFIVPKEGYSLDDVMTAANLNLVNNDKEFDMYENIIVDEAALEKYGYYGCQIGDELFINHYTHCVFPSFTISSDTNLKDTLSKNGYLTQTFEGFMSDIYSDDPLYVSGFMQSAKIEVDKSGVKAAAVTVISEEPGCAMEIEDHQSLVMDKNFGFILTDREDNILFEGKVINPVADNN